MKRHIKSTTELIELNVIINVGHQFSDVAASDVLDYVNHPRNIKKAERLDQTKLVVLNDIVSSILSVITSHQFKILKRYQSKKSYAYYVWCDIDPDRKYNLPVFKINFRIADHLNDGLTDTTVETSKLFVKSIMIGDTEYEDPMVMMTEFDKMCDELSNGNIRALYTYLE